MYFSLFRKIAASLLAKTILIDTALASNPPKEQEFHPQRIKCRSMSKRNNSSSKNILLRRVEFGNFSVVFESQIPNSTLRRRMFIINTTTSVDFDQHLWCLSQIFTVFLKIFENLISKFHSSQKDVLLKPKIFDTIPNGCLTF